MQERLQKILSQAGVTSRRKAEELIVEGRVSVNGKTFTSQTSMTDTIKRAVGTPLRLGVERGGRLIELTATPANGKDVTIIDAFEAVGACARGLITREKVDEIERAICPGEGACGAGWEQARNLYLLRQEEDHGHAAAALDAAFARIAEIEHGQGA